jgi:hypothetical protein
MGEIRSTLDIIMEKTRGLTMTEEEKVAYKQKELVGKVRGLIQKYLDKALSEDRLQVELTALGEMDRDRVKQVIIEETIPKIALGEDNEPVLNILESTIGVDTAPVKEVLADFEDRLGKEKDACEEKLRTRLVEKGISGSAAIPNIAADPEWARSVAQLEGVLKEKLNSLTLKD